MKPFYEHTPLISGQDSIDVVGHLALPNTAVSGIQTSAHGRRTFLELKDDEHRTLTVVDVTNPANPEVVKKLTVPTQHLRPNIEGITGNTASLTDESSQTVKAPESVSIVSFKDPSHPLTVRTFDEVSAVRKELGGIVYIANADGLWILKQNQPPDKSLEAEYRNYVLYGSR